MSNTQPATGAPLFDSFTRDEVNDHAALHLPATPGTPVEKVVIIDRSHEDAFILSVAGMPVAQINWTLEQDRDAFSDDDEVAENARGDMNGYYLRVNTIAVDEAFRRHGLATLLLDRFTAYATRHYGSTGWDPGTFSADGAAFYKAVRGEDVDVTSRIQLG